MNREDLKKEIGDLIWKMATNLVHGGKVSPVQFMDYTLGALFYRFISENITDYCNHLMTEAGVPNADYLHMSDEMAENARNQISRQKVSSSNRLSCSRMWQMVLRATMS